MCKILNYFENKENIIDKADKLIYNLVNTYYTKPHTAEKIIVNSFGITIIRIIILKSLC